MPHGGGPDRVECEALSMGGTLSRKILNVYLPLAILAGLWIYLVFVFAHSSGYGPDRVSLFASIKNLWRSPDWQHGALVPFIVAGLLIYQRKKIFTAEAKGSAWGLGLIVAAFFAYWAGYKTNLYYFGFGAIQVFLGGAIIWFLGWAYFRRLFFVWCFFAFTWPLYFLTDTIAFNLRLAMIRVSSSFLNLVGVANQRVGTSIQSAADFDGGIDQGALFAMDIADPCSGIRSLFALMMVSALWGYLTLTKPWQRIALFASAIPLAIFGNFVRVLLLVFGSMVFGSEIAVGVEGGTSNFHFVAGIAVFVVALGGMVLLSLILRSGWKVFQREKIVRSMRRQAVTEPKS